MSAAVFTVFDMGSWKIQLAAATFLPPARRARSERGLLFFLTSVIVIVSPHLAFYTSVDVEGMVRTSTEALLAFARGEDTPYEVR